MKDFHWWLKRVKGFPGRNIMTKKYRGKREHGVFGEQQKDGMTGVLGAHVDEK